MMNRVNYELDIVEEGQEYNKEQDYIFVAPSQKVKVLGVSIVQAFKPVGKDTCIPLTFLYRNFFGHNKEGIPVWQQDFIGKPREYWEVIDYCKKNKIILCEY